MEGRVLIVEPRELVRRATEKLLTRHALRVIAVDCAQAAVYLPHHFQCGIFSDTLPDANAISFAGWLLAESRIESAVFFGEIEDVDVRLRASNLGVFVGHTEGVGRLVRAALDCLAAPSLPSRTLGSPSLRIGAFAALENRRRIVV